MNPISLFIYSMLLNLAVFVFVYILDYVKIKVIKQDGKLFLIRLTFYFPKGSIKFHLIWNDDKEEPHTHPWKYTSFLLLGAYKETLFITPYTDGANVQLVHLHKMWKVIKRTCTARHLITLYTLWGIKIPCLTVGYYGEKEQLCSLCTSLGYCKTTGKSHH